MGDWQCGVSDNSNRLTHLDYEEVVVKKEDPLEHSEELSTNIVCCETTLKSEDFEYVEDETIKMEVYPEDLKVSLGELPTVVHEDSVDDMDDPQHNSTCVPIKKEDLPSSIKVLNEIKPTESEELDIHYENIKTEKIKEPSESELFFSCEVCKKVFVNKNDLLEHKSDKVDCIALDVDENEWKEDVKLTQGEDLKSSLLGPTTDFGVHFLHTAPCVGEILPSTMDNHESHEMITKEKSFCCEHCLKSFARKSILTLHRRVHSEDRPYQCKFCSRAFKRNADSLKHEKLHEGVKPYQCELCSESFAQKAYLRKHEKKHSDERFQCESCSGFFLSKSDLSYHTRIHTDEKPFRCKICSKAFTRNYHMLQHEKLHEGVKPFQCNLCSKTFALKSYLNIHEKTHAITFRCEICSLSFAKKRELSSHNKTAHSSIIFGAV